jgi:branched-chain amino acid transport system ATP-binding protein
MLQETPFFSVRNIGMNFGSLQALTGVTFDTAEGEIFGIAGPNGAGKTTLLNVISGSLKPSEGEVHLQGKRVSGLKPLEVCHGGIARIFQIPLVFPTLTVSQNIKVGAVFGHTRGHKSPRTLEELLRFVELQGKEDVLAANIDLYSRKLLMLGAALATDPKILLLDEPLGGLNFSEIDIYLRMVKKLNQEMGITFLVVEHIFDKLVEISDNILILNFGGPIYLGAADTVTQDPKVIEVYLGMQHA